MARLEACYFCGTAEDEPLRAVTVTPRRRRDDPDAAVTLTLCRACEGKLERVLDGLFERVESGTREGQADAATTEPEEQADEDVGPIDRIDVAASRSGEGRRRLFTDVDRRDAGSGDDEGDDESADDAEIIEEEPTVTARATAGSKPNLDGVSVAEYNRVMRLLQNREFPMDRAAFVDLAANAYDLAEETVESVLDAVIDQGALVDREGELVRPSEGGSP